MIEGTYVHHIFDRTDLVTGNVAAKISLASNVHDALVDFLQNLDLLIVASAQDVVFCGGLFHDKSVTGLGSSVAAAMTRLMSEAAELAALSDAVRSPHPDLLARDLATGLQRTVPGMLLDSKTRPVSEGCAAHTDPNAARLHGLGELIERDAVILWWTGGRRGRTIKSKTARRSRETVLIDIATDLPGSAVAAVSFGPDGTGFACGSAGATDRITAIRAAERELVQMEIGLYLIALKEREIGPESLTDQDRLHVDRSLAICRDAFLDTAIDGTAGADAPPTCAEPVAWAQALNVHGIDLYDIPMGTQFGLHVHKIASPQLQPSAPSVRTQRLVDAENTGPGPAAHLQTWPVL